MSSVSAALPAAGPPLIAHILHGLSLGGLETKLMTLLKLIPEDRYRHAIVCMTDEIDGLVHDLPPNVSLTCIHKNPGQDVPSQVKLWKVLLRLQPDIVHTRNLGTLEAQMPAAFAGVPIRIHGVHGRDIRDPDGKSRKYLFLHRCLRPFIHRYVAVSGDLAGWVRSSIHVPGEDVVKIYNGVDGRTFAPRMGPRAPLGPPGFMRGDSFVIGAVGRLRPIKDQRTLIKAFAEVLRRQPYLRDRLRLVIVGDGPTAGEIHRTAQETGCQEFTWLAGSRHDIPEIMRSLDLFVLPSLGEGLSNTVLEAMAAGLPVLATRVGGNPELVDDGQTGTLVPRANPPAMADAILRYVNDPVLANKHGKQGRKKAEKDFTLDVMVDRYLSLYDGLVQAHQPARERRVRGPARSGETKLSRNGSGLTKNGIVKNLGFHALAASGANFAFRSALRKKLTVVCYHGVVPQERPEEAFFYRNAVSVRAFRKQIGFLARKFRPITMKDLLRSAGDGEALPNRALLVTFDDGYRNNFRYAAPILRELGMPAAIFVATSYIGDSRNLWANEIDFYVLKWGAERFPMPDGRLIPLPPGQEGKYALAVQIRQICKRLPEPDLQRYLAMLLNGGASGAGSDHRELFEFMTWDEVGRLEREGIYIGSHSVTHPILTRITPDRLRDEMKESKRQLESRLSAPCECIAYPNGEITDYSAEVMKAAADAGYKLGFTLTGRTNAHAPNQFAIHRVGVPGHVAPKIFEGVVSGSYAWLKGI